MEVSMKTKIAVLIALMAATAAAQSSSGYVFFAPGGLKEAGHTNVTTLHGGGGLDAVIAKGIGVNVELGGLWPRQCFGDCVVGVFSTGGAIHFRRGAELKLDPFVNAGYTLMFRNGRENLFYFGGGANYWTASRVGLRLEFRDNISTHYSTAHFWSVRMGLACR
jgi:hypothetical protein